MDNSTFLDAAAKVREVRVVVRTRQGEVRTPIWIVVVGREVFVRSYRADGGQWYQHVTSSESFPLELRGELVSVRTEPEHDAQRLEEISEAYLAKYAGEPEVADMVSSPVVATTLRLVPIEQ